LKQSYSLDTKLRYLYGEISIADKKRLPRSTTHYWKKSKSINEFCNNNLWDKIENTEPAKLVFENKNLHNQFDVLTVASAWLCKMILKNKLSPQCKKDIITNIEKIKEHTTLQKACSYFSISTRQYHAWKNNIGCHQSAIKLCRKKFPNQLTIYETGLIKKYMEDVRYLQWSRISVYWQLCKQEGHLFAKSTFYKYCKTLGYGRRTGFRKCKKNSTGIKAHAVGEIIHADITELYSKNHQKAYILFVQDNFSRKIIGFHVARENNSLLQAATIKLALENIGNAHHDTLIITDGGSENKGTVDEMLKACFPKVRKIIAKADVPFANNIVEALHYKMKYQVLPKDGFDCFNSVFKTLPGYVELYNNMPHDSLHGCTPNEAFAGILPDFKTRLLQLKHAAAVRLNYNKEFNCCNA
jgi:putative transposase